MAKIPEYNRRTEDIGNAVEIVSLSPLRLGQAIALRSAAATVRASGVKVHVQHRVLALQPHGKHAAQRVFRVRMCIEHDAGVFRLTGLAAMPSVCMCTHA